MSSLAISNTTQGSLANHGQVDCANKQTFPNIRTVVPIVHNGERRVYETDNPYDLEIPTPILCHLCLSSQGTTSSCFQYFHCHAQAHKHSISQVLQSLQMIWSYNFSTFANFVRNSHWFLYHFTGASSLKRTMRESLHCNEHPHFDVDHPSHPLKTYSHVL